MIKIKDLNKKQKIMIVIFAIIVIIGIYIYQSNKQKNFDVIENNLDEAVVNDNKKNDNKNEDNKKDEDETEKNKETIKVHVTGAVSNEGVVELNIDSRISDAIEKAGGLREDAYLEPINLAYILEDGMKIYIPNQSEKEKYQNIDESKNESLSSTGNSVIGTSTIINNSSQRNKEGSKKIKVNMNTATQTELETLPGIGPSIAQKIISYRNEKGKFKSIEDIKNVSGIGESKYNKIKDYIVVK